MADYGPNVYAPAMAAAGAQLGQGIMRGLDNYHQMQTGAKVADAVYNHLDALSDSDGDGTGTPNPLGDPDQWKTLGARDKIAALQGYMQTTAMAQRQQQLQNQTGLIQAQMGRWNAVAGNQDAQAQLRQQQAQDDQATGDFMKAYMTAPQTTTNEDGDDVPATPQDRFSYAAGKTPNVNGRNLPQILDSLARWEQVQNAADADSTVGAPKTTTVGGKTVIYNPKSGAFQTVDDTAAQPQEVADEDGNVYGHNVPNGKGGFKFVPVPKSGAKFTAIQDPETGEIKHTVSADNLDDYKAGVEQLQQLQAGSGGATPPTAPVLMTNPQGQQVKVPLERVNELKKKGYK